MRVYVFIYGVVFLGPKLQCGTRRRGVFFFLSVHRRSSVRSAVVQAHSTKTDVENSGAVLERITIAIGLWRSENTGRPSLPLRILLLVNDGEMLGRRTMCTERFLTDRPTDTGRRVARTFPLEDELGLLYAQRFTNGQIYPHPFLMR